LGERKKERTRQRRETWLKEGLDRTVMDNVEEEI
jgi:hypothetical protein